MPRITRTECYLHASRDSMFDLGHKLGLVGEPLRTFAHAFTELKVEFEVDLDSGLVKSIKAINDGQHYTTVPQP